MASVSTSIDIGSPPDRVWDLFTDLEASPQRLEQLAEG